MRWLHHIEWNESLRICSPNVDNFGFTSTCTSAENPIAERALPAGVGFLGSVGCLFLFIFAFWGGS